MKKLLAVMLMPVFWTPLPVISTEKVIPLSNTDLYQLGQDIVKSTKYYHQVPKNPNLFQDSVVYNDMDLTVADHLIEPDTTIQIVNLGVNNHQVPVFELADGKYIEASRYIIYEDQVISQSSVDLKFWTQKHMTIYPSPYVLGVKETKVAVEPNVSVHASNMAQTHHGTYYLIDQKGWVHEKDLSISDNRMSKVQEMLSNKYNKDQYSIFVKQLDTQASAGINADKTMYAASISKLATLYHVQKQLNVKKHSDKDMLTYIDAVNHFYGDYDPTGSGEMSKTADHKDYSIKTLLKAVAKHSDNVATNLLGYYICQQYQGDFQNELRALSGIDWDMEKRLISSKAAANVMEAIYYQKGDIISYLSATDFDDSRIAKNIPVPVAHKIGDAYDYKHDVAIVYGKSPFILSVMTDKASYDDITNIADDVYSILK